ATPHVLKFGVELVMDGRQLPRPVNYVLARVTPPKGVVVNEKKRPFVVVDPRAGHGPGIGGFKAQSEIGVAFQAGHPCYFIGFLPEPMCAINAGKSVESTMGFTALDGLPMGTRPGQLDAGIVLYLLTEKGMGAS